MSSISTIIDNLRENRWSISQTNATERIKKLKNLRKHILENREKIYQALRNDFQKNEVEIELTEIQPAIAEINFCIKRLKKWMKPQKVKTPLRLMGTKSRLLYEAKGVVLIISPWNYPFHLAIVPLISAVAAGNCVVLKPSEITCETSKLLQRLLSQVFLENEVSVVEGDASVAKELLTFSFDHVFFTGSSNIGKQVLAATANNLTSVTLELGGKSPAIVDKTANIKKAAERIVWGKFLNAGQTCVAPDYVFVDRKIQQQFCEAVMKTHEKFYGSAERPKIGNIVNTKHWQRLRGILDEEKQRGAKILLGGFSDETERYFSPTVICGVSLDSPIMEQEIFGPILPIIFYDNIENVSDFIRKKDKPLAIYLFSQLRANIRHIITNTTCGGTCINNVAIHLGNPYLPFGGVNTSGIGEYHGFFGFKTFSHGRSVLYQGRFSGLSFIYPPYNKWTEKLARSVTNIFS
ncbi:aldehyde dehydrogenase family protein [Candidatus Uabimicrobium sp. HlEnr_7]|uniref:aldehyde dehydrogenase family protein n=1 Tax=Candidatus Uabimicrobium helgolandensis TaxID=3095367 RepID=UPI003557B949